ncbi:DNA methyltransferase, partial [Ralstonia pseudosolanacearum]|uniref:DNA methyltransferase n=1 Tax=Ralstonia pseudosolanacearum TaxID=1310165 RepID=UPI003CF5A177
PIIRLDDLTDEQRRAYTLIHNQTTMNTGFDIDILNEELGNLDIDMSEFGFENITEDDIEIEEDGFNFEEELPPEAKSKKGEIYQLGNHRLMCGDSTKPEDVEKLMNGNLADLVVTDPPYNVNISNSQGMQIENDDMQDEAFKEFLIKAFRNMNEALKEGGAFYVWYASREHINFESALNENDLYVRQQLIWVKNTFILG